VKVELVWMRLEFALVMMELTWMMVELGLVRLKLTWMWMELAWEVRMEIEGWRQMEEESGGVVWQNYLWKEFVFFPLSSSEVSLLNLLVELGSWNSTLDFL